MSGPQVLHGTAAAPGIAIGPALIYRPAAIDETAALPTTPAEEVARLEQAAAAAAEAMARTEAQLQQAGKSSEADIFAAHQMILNDPSLRERARALIVENGQRAATAIGTAGEEQAADLLALDDPYFSARATDVRDVVGQVQRLLTGGATLGERLAAPALIVANDLGPSDLMSVPREHLLGFALAAGGATAHATILARALEIPAIIGLGAALDQIEDGVLLALDGATGEIVVAPDAATLSDMRSRADAVAAQRSAFQRQRDLPTVTRDGQAIALVANVASAAEARAAQEWGAAGVGLLRTELLFTGPTLPDEEAQLALYAAVAAELPGKPIVVRTLDVGGDKQMPALPLPQEDNPFLGWRGIRIGLSRPDLLVPQFRALLRAGANADIRIMLPMITTVAEVRQARALLEQAQEELRAAGLPCADKPQLGIMIEVPAAALMADGLAQVADFFSIGTNDLTQYTLACERLNPRVAALYQPLEPAVLRLIAMTAEAGRRAGRHVAVCGEMAADPALTALLIGLGVEELSCAPPAIPRVRAAIRATDADAAREMARAVLSATRLEDVNRILATAATP